MAAILAGIVANCLVSVGSVIFSLHKEMVISLLPKSVTTAISVDLSPYDGRGECRDSFAIVVSTGIFWLADRYSYFPGLFKIESPVARGVALEVLLMLSVASKSNRDWRSRRESFQGLRYA